MRDYEEKSYYEIQLDNKQLVLVFLASITVCILIFVLGVMVGKGKKEAEMAAVSKKEVITPQPDSLQPVEPQVAVETEEKQPKKAPKQAKQPEKAEEEEPEGYSFYDLDKTEPTKTEPQQPAKKEPVPVKKEIAKEAPPRPEISLPSPDTILRYTVQVMATSSETKAMEQLSSLKQKGYSAAFLDQDQTEEGPVYKVRVGKFSDHDSARKTASQLKQDLKLDTWVAVLD